MAEILSSKDQKRRGREEKERETFSSSDRARRRRRARGKTLALQNFDVSSGEAGELGGGSEVSFAKTHARTRGEETSAIYQPRPFKDENDFLCRGRQIMCAKIERNLVCQKSSHNRLVEGGIGVVASPFSLLSYFLLPPFAPFRPAREKLGQRRGEGKEQELGGRRGQRFFVVAKKSKKEWGGGEIANVRSRRCSER